MSTPTLTYDISVTPSAVPEEKTFSALDKKKLLKLLLISSTIHAFFIVISHMSLSRRRINLDDGAVSVDILQDFAISSAKDTALPQAKIAEEARVANVLPQLPKQFQIDDKKDDAASADEEIKKSEKEEEKAKPEEDKSILVKKREEEEAQKIAKEDALKRIALERLRLEDKRSAETTALKKDAIARLKDEVAQGKGAATSGGTGKAGKHGTFLSLLRVAVQRQWSLPESFKSSSGKLETVIRIRLDSGGKLTQTALEKSSGNKSYDEFALRAVQAANPLPQPPSDLVGEDILLPFVN